MLLRQIRTSIVIASAVAVLAPRASEAQATAAAVKTDARWLAWLGCWAPDTTSGTAGVSRTPTSNITCIVPVKGARTVDALTIVRGKVTMRDRLDASGRPHAIDGQGCEGTELVSWSASNRRVYLHADYTCGGTPGNSATIFAMSPTGEWLRVEQVRSGSGSIASVDRLRPVSAPEVLAADVVSMIEREQRAAMTARAASAAPITTDEVIDAVRRLDADVVRSWIVASGQTFDADAAQIDRLASAGVPAPVIEAVAAASPAYQSAIASAQARSSDVYGSAEALTEQASRPMTTMRVCPPDGCSPNRYSTYNGYGYNYGYGYPAAVYPYGYLPYYYTSPVIVRAGRGLGGRSLGHGGIGRGNDHGIGRGGDHGDGRGPPRGASRGGGQRYEPPSRPAPPKTAVIAGRRRGP